MQRNNSEWDVVEKENTPLFNHPGQPFFVDFEKDNSYLNTVVHDKPGSGMSFIHVYASSGDTPC